MNILRLVLFLTIQFIFSLTLTAADNDFMRSMGKMYVVVGVIILMFLGIVLYLIQIDRRLTKFENQIKSDE